MQRLRLTITIASLVLLGCDRKSDFITEKSPFVSVTILTPRDGKAAIAGRGKRFAVRHGMKVHFVPDHFEPQEFALSLTRTDLNIVADNVKLGDRSFVTAVALAAPTSKQQAEVDAYLCEVMRHGCSNQ